ncbi:MAG: MFS transporter [Bdellovibrionales bacterium]|nr:MFS transporter [Oligoflexia bacterium]
MREILKQKVLWIAAFGYFVDLFDLILYGAVRVDSLKSLGYQGNDIFSVGATLLNIQMAGMLLGGLMWGVIGDRRGRREALFGSIFIYSLATFLNAYVHDFAGYATLRFLAGVGLAGELGAAITLISEALPGPVRGMGSAFVASVGFLGAAVSSYVCQLMSWQNAYRVGGTLGFLLLLSRFSIQDSLIFVRSRTHENKDTFGSLALAFQSKRRLKTFLLALLAGIPVWYVAGILGYFAPEFAKELKTTGVVTAGTTIMMGYLGSILGDIACGLLSQKLKSRKKAVLYFMIGGALLAILHPLFSFHASPLRFYWVRFAIGFGNGFFAILIAWIAEMFGTNLRATMTSTLANLIRASVIPLTLGFQYLNPHFGMLWTSALLGSVCFTFGILAVLKLPETFHRDLNYLETTAAC